MSIFYAKHLTGKVQGDAQPGPGMKGKISGMAGGARQEVMAPQPRITRLGCCERSPPGALEAPDRAKRSRHQPTGLVP